MFARTSLQHKRHCAWTVGDASGTMSALPDTDETLHVGGRVLRLIPGDITALDRHVAAIVSTDDNLLSHGGGVSEAIWRAAGPDLDAFVATRTPTLELGSIFVTPAGALNAEVILHAVTIDVDANRTLEPSGASAFCGALVSAASALGAETLALPLVGSGRARMTPKTIVGALVTALGERELEGGALAELLLVVPETLVSDVSAELRRLTPQPTLQALVEALLRTLEPGPAKALEAAWRDVARDESPFAAALLLETLIEHAGSGARTTPQQGLGARLAKLARDAEARGTPLPSETHSAVRRGIEARHRLAHVRTPVVHRDVRAILAGARALARWILADTPMPDAPPERPVVARSLAKPPSLEQLGVVGDVGWWEAASAPASAARPAPPTAEPPRASTGTTLATSTPSGTQHVRRLHEFLVEAMPPEERKELHEDLRREGYRGSEEACLLEYCVRVDDPIELVASTFSARALRRELKERVGEELPFDTHARALAMRLLSAFGFPRPGNLDGLSAVSQRLRRLRAEVHASSVVQVKGLVQDAGAWMEHLSQILLRFVTRVVFDQPAEVYFKETNKLERSYRLEKCSLGKLLELIDHLAVDIERSDSARVRALRAELDGERISPKGATTIAGLRNKLAHANGLEDESTPAEARRVALEFFDAALGYLDYLGAPERRVFPTLIRVESVTLDRWGRRLVRAVDDEGNPEYLFQDLPVAPGETYFMRPLSNPMRVDPILVPMGDMSPKPPPER